MKKSSIVFVLLLISANAVADSGEPVAKPFSIGIGTYADTVSFDRTFQDDKYRGLALSAGYVISNSFALRGTFFSLKDDASSDAKYKGFDLVAHLGTGLATEGLKAYIGGGLFKSSLKITGTTIDESFTGLQLNGGIGYNWESVSLDLIIGIRDSSDYERLVNKTAGSDVTTAEVSGSLLLSARF